MRILWELMSVEDEDDAFLPDDEINDFDKEEDEKYSPFGEMQTKKIMPTPFGLAVIDNSLNPFRKIQFFQFHTDFYLTQKILNIIETTPGVETLRFLTPYRGILSVGKIFNSTDVRREIERRVIKNDIPNAEIKNQIEKLKTELSKYKSWSILVFPNGYADYCYLKDDNSNKEEYDKVVNLYVESLNYNHGVLLQSPIKDEKE